MGVAVELNRRLHEEDDTELILLVRKERFFWVKRLYCCLGAVETVKAETLMEVVALLNRVEIIILIVNVTDRDNIVITFMWDMRLLFIELFNACLYKCNF